MITATSNFTGSAVESVFVPMLTLQVRLTAVGESLVGLITICAGGHAMRFLVIRHGVLI